MSLTAEQLRRREEAEQSFERVRALKKMSGAELRRVLGGDPAEAAPWSVPRPNMASPSASSAGAPC